MKKITDVIDYTSLIVQKDVELLRNEAITTIKEILSRNKDIDF